MVPCKKKAHIKYENLTTSGKKIIHVTKVNVLEVGQKSMSKILVQMKKSYDKKYTFEIWKTYLIWFKRYNKGIVQSISNFKGKVIRSKIMVLIERSCHKEYTRDIWKTCLNGL